MAACGKPIKMVERAENSTIPDDGRCLTDAFRGGRLFSCPLHVIPLVVLVWPPPKFGWPEPGSLSWNFPTTPYTRNVIELLSDPWLCLGRSKPRRNEIMMGAPSGSWEASWSWIMKALVLVCKCRRKNLDYRKIASALWSPQLGSGCSSAQAIILSTP